MLIDRATPFCNHGSSTRQTTMKQQTIKPLREEHSFAFVSCATRGGFALGVDMRKVCRTCKAEKALTEFHKLTRAADGLDYECKRCSTKRTTKWGKSNPERANEQTRRSEASRKERTGESRAEARWRKEKGSRPRYHRTRYDVLLGRKHRIGTCLACSAQDVKLQYHHVDAISDHTIPLCRPCHLAMHGKRARV